MLVNIDSNKLKQQREQKCWSQQQLADCAGLSLRTVQRIEAKSVASLESLKSIAAAFDIHTDALLLQTQAKVDDSQWVAKESLKRLYIAFVVVFASHMFGFWGIFSAFEGARISESVFQILKNTVSIALLVSTAVLAWRVKRIKKTYGVGSSFL